MSNHIIPPQSSSAAQTYCRAVEMLQGASRGTCRAPKVSPAALAKKMDSIAGLDTGLLRAAASSAVGRGAPGKLKHPMGGLRELLVGVAEGVLGNAVYDFFTGLFENHDKRVDVEDFTAQCADAIDQINDDAAKVFGGVADILLGGISMVTILMGGIDPAQNTSLFNMLRSLGERLVDSAGHLLYGSCEDRDEALRECMKELTKLGQERCVEPAAAPAAVAKHLGSCEGQGTVPAVVQHGGDGAGVVAGGQGAPVAPAAACPPVAPAAPAAPASVAPAPPAAPASVAPVAPAPPAAPASVAPVAPAPPSAPASVAPAACAPPTAAMPAAPVTGSSGGAPVLSAPVATSAAAVQCPTLPAETGPVLTGSDASQVAVEPGGAGEGKTTGCSPAQPAECIPAADPSPAADAAANPSKGEVPGACDSPAGDTAQSCVPPQLEQCAVDGAGNLECLPANGPALLAGGAAVLGVVAVAHAVGEWLQANNIHNLGDFLHFLGVDGHVGAPETPVAPAPEVDTTAAGAGDSPPPAPEAANSPEPVQQAPAPEPPPPAPAPEPAPEPVQPSAPAPEPAPPAPECVPAPEAPAEVKTSSVTVRKAGQW